MTELSDRSTRWDSTAALPDPVDPSRALAKSRRTTLICRVGAVVVVLGAWQLVAGGPKSIVPMDAVSRPSSIARAFWHLIGNGQIFSAFGATVEAVAIGMVIAAPIGLLLALVTASRLGKWLFEPMITILYAIPKVGLITVYALILGPTAKTHIAVVVSAVAFTYYYGVSQALRGLDRSKLSALRLMGAGRLKTARLFVFPSAIPELFAATRIALPLAFALQIYSELRVPATNGLGALLATFSNTLDSAGAMSLLLLVALVAYLLDVVLAGAVLRYTKSIGMGITR